MSLLQWNPNARITNLSLVATNPGQITHTIPSTGVTRIFNRGAGQWTGTLQLGVVSNMEQGQMIEAFISALNGSQNTTRIPLINIKRFRRDSTAPIQFRNIEQGRYYNYKNRLILSNGGASVFPDLPIQPTEMITPATFIQIRRAPDSQTLMPHQPDRYGPWTLQFIESLTS